MVQLIIRVRESVGKFLREAQKRISVSRTYKFYPMDRGRHMLGLVAENISEMRHEFRIRSQYSFRLPVVALGRSLGLFFVITFIGWATPASIQCVSDSDSDVLDPSQVSQRQKIGWITNGSNHE
mgnify:CR=1 FL=1